MKTREYYVLPVDSFGQPIGYVETIQITEKDYKSRKELIELDENMVIETYYNPMGAFTYKKYNEEEE